VDHFKSTVTLLVFGELASGKRVVEVSHQLERLYTLGLDRLEFASQGFGAADVQCAV
jgi:hypothetical protein